MKDSWVIIFVCFFVLCSCNNISSKSVFEKLSTEELSSAIKKDTTFSAFYENLRKGVDTFSEIKMAKYNEVTYRRLFQYYKFLTDTNYWKPLTESWDKEWEKKFGIYIPKADSTLNYWRNYLLSNSLNKYVKIELAVINKDYYEYIGGLKDVSIGFKLTPLQGSIEQIRFNYGYKPKINGDGKYFNKHNCISTSPFSSPTVRYWEVGYSDKDNFSGENVETFLRDYNLYIEITHIRKDGKNITIEDFNIPKEVSQCFEYEKDYPVLYEAYKEDLIKELINSNYVSKWEYRIKKADEIREKKDKVCFDFSNDL